MASLQQLLTEEGFERRNSAKYRNPMKQKDKLEPVDVKLLPAYICHDRKSSQSSKQKSEKAAARSCSSSFQSKRAGSALEGSKSSNFNSLESADSTTVGPPMDAVAIKAVIGILSGYTGRYIKDDVFRNTIREKCKSCLVRRRRTEDSDDGVFVNFEMGIENVEKLVEDQGARKQMKIEILKNSIELLNIVASLNSKTTRNGSTCGIPNSHISACAQFYLAIVYKMDKNDRIAARHLLQVFCDSPYLARIFLLPDLWEHLFLPHLLHLKVWYTKEIESLSNVDHVEKEKEMKALSKVYNHKMDKGTNLFALYYKQWLKVGADEPPLPIVPLPSRPSHNRSSGRKSSDTYISHSPFNTSHSSINPNLYQAVFGPKLERQCSSLDERKGILAISLGSEIDGNLYGDYYNCCSVQTVGRNYLGRSSRQINKKHAELWPESHRVDYFQCLTCRNIPTESLVDGNHIAKSASVSVRNESTLLSSDFIGAVTAICSSDILSECEFAIRLITKAWLNSHGDAVIEEELTKPSVIEGMLEVLFASNEDEILELIISILAELVGRNEITRQVILNSDPQLEIFVRLLRKTSLFLKAAVLLYLAKPLAKQMISAEWVPLVLRVLEFGDKLQTLFTVQCNPQVAAFYFLDQLLTGFDEDKNLENARQVVSLGGLSLLMKRIEAGETYERNISALVISCCIQAEGSCRSFLADNLNAPSLLELIVLGNNKNPNGCAFSLLVELLCLDRRTKISSFINGLKEGWGGLNTMHIFFVYLQRTLPEERPLVAAILLLLDLMEDPFGSSLYREEAIEAIIAALNCQTCDDRIQERSARALLLLGGHFSYKGESLMEKWLLRRAGFQENCFEDSVHGKEIVVYDPIYENEEEELTENWQKRAAFVLLKTGNKRLLSALADCMGNGIPSLARVSLITVSWMSSYLHLVEDTKLPPMAFSILRPQLLDSLNYDRDVEERVLASYSLLCLVKSSGCVSIHPLSMDKESLRHLRNISLVTWTANELISILSNSSLQSI